MSDVKGEEQETNATDECAKWGAENLDAEVLKDRVKGFTETFERI